MLQCAANHSFLPVSDTAGTVLIRHFLCLLPALPTCVCIQSSRGSLPKMVHPFFSGCELLLLCFYSMSWSLQEWQCGLGIKYLTLAKAHGLHGIPGVPGCCSGAVQLCLTAEEQPGSSPDSWMQRRKECFPGEQYICFKQTKALPRDINKTVDLCAAKGGGHSSLLACAPGWECRCMEWVKTHTSQRTGTMLCSAPVCCPLAVLSWGWKPKNLFKWIYFLQRAEVTLLSFKHCSQTYSQTEILPKKP